MTSKIYPLTPSIHPFTKQVLDQPTLFGKHILDDIGTINLVFPQVVKENYQKFQQVFGSYGVSHAIHYAHKPNKSFAIVRELANAGASIDVASLNELKQAIHAGFKSSHICAGGPKNMAYIEACIEAGITISIDSIGEFERIATILREKNKEHHPILIRLNVESLLGMEKESRFGICKEEVVSALSILQENRSFFRFLGFSFHINAEAKKLRTKVFETVLDYSTLFMKEGFSPTHINIGGGFRINYIENGNDWHEYTSAIITSVIEQQGFLGWNNSGLGYWNEEGTLRGKPQFADMYQKTSQYDELSEFLGSRIERYEKTVAEILQDYMFTLMIEPGRSMLDSAGMTITKIIDKKKTSLGNNVLIVDMNRSQLDVQDQAYMVDPILFEKKKDQKTYETFLAGNLCMKSDIIFHHKTFLPYEPDVNEYLAFVNTAAYYMDFGESNTLQQPIAPKYAIYTEQKALKIVPDTHYSL